MRLSTRRLPAAITILAFSITAAVAKPNFTGDWKLNTSKSEFGQMPAPDSMTDKITHDDPNLTVEVKQSSQMGDFEWVAKYTTDGKESTNTIRENPSTSIVTWDGDALVFATKGKFGDNEFTLKDRWTLSDDGKVLTMNRLFSSSFGEGEQKLVFEKQ